MEGSTMRSVGRARRRLSRRTLILLGLNVAAFGFLIRVVRERRDASRRLEACLDALARHRSLYEGARGSPAARAQLRAIEDEIRALCG